MKDLKISKRKPSFPVKKELHSYLSEYNRNIRIPIFYEDLLRFQGSVVVYDKNDVDTLWIRVYYNEFERQDIDLSLKKIYAIFGWLFYVLYLILGINIINYVIYIFSIFIII